MQLISCEAVFIEANYSEVILPSIWEQQTFIDKAGPEILNQMWAFRDKGDRPVCLVPEMTGVVQELYRDKWQSEPKPIKLFYVSRCYRYDRPQRGRYREFTQVGVEALGGKVSREEMLELLCKCLDLFPGVKYKVVSSVKRGLSYYTEDGFEVECESLGAQRQVAGGGRYAEGIGFAIGLDRLLLANDSE